MQSCKGRVVSRATSISPISLLPAAFACFNALSKIESDGCFPPSLLYRGPDSGPSAAKGGHSPAAGTFQAAWRLGEACCHHPKTAVLTRWQRMQVAVTAIKQAVLLSCLLLAALGPLAQCPLCHFGRRCHCSIQLIARTVTFKGTTEGREPRRCSNRGALRSCVVRSLQGTWIYQTVLEKLWFWLALRKPCGTGPGKRRQERAPRGAVWEWISETLGIPASELGKGCNNSSNKNKKNKIIAATRKEE